jgi:hypothetical protein
MPIPASGPISMSMFNTELGRASNTANSSLAGGLTPAVGSQFWLANQSGSLNQTAPHAMSEWYGYGVNIYYTVNIYIRQGGTPSPAGSAQLYRSTDGINWTYSGPIDTTTCTLYPINTFTLLSGTTLYLGVVNSAFNEVYFNAAASSTCPSNAATYCFGGFSQTVTANTNIAITAYVAKFGTYVECGGFCNEC